MKSTRDELRGLDVVDVPPTPGRIATHEAGHAAMCILLGGNLRSVTIEFRRGQPPRAMTEERSPSNHVLVAVAGGVAESIRYRQPIRIAGEDMKHALQVVDLHGVRRFARIASSLLRVHWPGVVALAEALLERKTLRGKDALDVFARALVPPKPKRHGGKRR